MENTDTIIDISNVTMRFNLAEQKTDTTVSYTHLTLPTKA